MTANSDTVSTDSSDVKSFYSKEDLLLLDSQNIPGHVAIVMDGNRRWAKKRHLPQVMGHWEGAETLQDIIRAASELGIKTITVYSFSTENWRRPEKEIEALMNIFELYLTHKREVMVKEGVRLNAIGDLTKLPPKLQEAFYQTKKATAGCDKINLVLALNYGGRDELKRAFQKIFHEIIAERISLEAVTEEYIAQFLDTAAFGDPDLLIRTSGELRLSNFLLWQISYTEFFVTDVLWPDFSAKTLLDAVLSYQNRSRRLGGTC